MNITQEAVMVLQDATEYAKMHDFEYVTPEMVLLGLCKMREFGQAFEECGGNLKGLMADLEDICDIYVDRAETEEPPFSVGVKHILVVAGEQAENSGRDEIALIHLVYAILRLQESYAPYFIEKQGVEPVDLLRAMEDGTDREESSSNDETAGFAPCLNDTLEDVNPLIGREDELERTIEILCRKDKNNPLYIGEPGVGKTAVVYGFVERLRENRVPKPLLGSRVFALDLGGMLVKTSESRK